MTHTTTNRNEVVLGQPNASRLCQEFGVTEGGSFAWPCEGARPKNWETDTAGITCLLTLFSG